MNAAKTALRRQMRTLRRDVTPERRAVDSAAICRRILARADVKAARAARRPVAVYLASSEEIDLAPLIAALRAEAIPVAAPRWNGTCYDLALLDGMVLVTGPHGILEPPPEAPAVTPAEIGVWILPGLAFTETGGRLGYGGGWYDRFLAVAAAGAITLGVAYPFQVVDKLPHEIHDRPIDAVVVP